MGQSCLVSLNVALGALADALVLLAILFIGRAFYRLTAKAKLKSGAWSSVKLEEEIATKDNTAMGVALGGYLLGLAIAASGAVLGPGSSWEKALMIGVVGLASMILMRVSLLINDKLILSKFHNLSEIVNDQNAGVAFVEAGGCVATGLMICGVMSTKADNVADKLQYGAIYWIAGQVILVACSKLFRPISGFDVDREIEVNHNAAAGLSFGGFLVAIGFIVQAALDGASTDLLPEFATIAVFSVVGLLLLAVGKLALGRVLMPTSPISKEIQRDKNLGAGALSAAGFIAIAVVFAASIAPATTFATFASALKEEAPAIVAPAPQEPPAQPETKQDPAGTVPAGPSQEAKPEAKATQ